jgi:hypothetical protein
MGYVIGLREGFPPETYKRVIRHENFAMHVGRPWTGARMCDGQIQLDTARGPFEADFAICGTGVEHYYTRRPELAGFAENIARWADRYTPPENERNERLGRFPYLAPDYAFIERAPGLTPWIANIHLFGIGTTMSFGPAGSSINAMTTAVPRLVAGLTRGLFTADLELHWQSLQDYYVQQVELDPARVVSA